MSSHARLTVVTPRTTPRLDVSPGGHYAWEDGRWVRRRTRARGLPLVAITLIVFALVLMLAASVSLVEARWDGGLLNSTGR